MYKELLYTILPRVSLCLIWPKTKNMSSTFKLRIQSVNSEDPLGDKWRSWSAGNEIPVKRTSCLTKKKMST